VSNRGPSIRHGVFLRCAICSRAWLAPGCPAHPQSELHHRCALGEPACTWFSGRYGQWMPLQLCFFAITLQSKVHNVVQYFCIGPYFVPQRDLEKVSFKDSFSYENQRFWLKTRLQPTKIEAGKVVLNLIQLYHELVAAPVYLYKCI